jgi:BEN domain
VAIGKTTRISAVQFQAITWSEPWQATKDLVTAVFGRNVLSTHSLTGCRINSAVPAKPALDPVKIHEIIGKSFMNLP